jgi:hypothetical protein
MLAAVLALHVTENRIGAAIAGTWGGNIGYFGTILIRDMLHMQRALHMAGRSYDLKAFAHNVRLLIIEFGVAELFDSLLVRPALMYYLPIRFRNFSAGIIVAKFLADISFYLPAILFYEWGRKRYRNF